MFEPGRFGLYQMINGTDNTQNVLAATYPDVFAAGIAYAGVPAGCFMSADDIPDFWNSTCSTGQSVWTQQQWTNIVKNMYPGYTGARPKMQIYHGSVDETLNVQNYYETIKQWTGVFGYSATAVSTVANYPRSPYTKYVFGDKFQVSAICLRVRHSVRHEVTWIAEYCCVCAGFLGHWRDSLYRRLPGGRSQVVRFHGKIDESAFPEELFKRADNGHFRQTPVSPTSTPATPSTTIRTSTTTSSASATTTAAGGSGTAPHWAQCGGNGWTGATAVCSFFLSMRSTLRGDADSNCGVVRKSVYVCQGERL